MTKIKKSNVVANVWRHWKPTFAKNKLGITATFLFYSLSAFVDLMLKPTQWKNAFDALANHANPWPAFNYIIWLAVLGWIFSRVGEYALTISEARIIKQLKDYAIRGLLGKSTHFFSTHSSGGLVAKTRRFASVSEEVIDQLVFSIVKSAIFVLYLVIYTAIIMPSLSLLFVLWVSIFVTFTMYMSRIRMQRDLASSTADSATTAHISDILLSVLTLRVFTAVSREVEKFSETTKEEQRLRLRAWFFGNLQWAGQGVFMLFLEIFAMYLVIGKVISGEVTIGTAVMVQVYIASLAMYMWNVGQSLIRTRTAFASAYEMTEMLDEEETEFFHLEDDSVELDSNRIVLTRSLSFAYPESVKSNSWPIRHTIGFREPFSFEQGRRYGIVGKSGAGKTSLIKLLLRLYEPTSGQIKIGGIPIESMTKTKLRSLIAYVPQSPHFPNRTLREILLLGSPNASDEQIIEALRKASCDFVWEKFPDALDTYVGERGIKLSGGEAQRIAIACAILKDAPIVIMDEPTSALDAGTERSIQESIKTHFHGKTLIVIAHRLSTVAVLDEVVLMKDGDIVLSAQHEELLKISEYYAHMWELQTNPNAEHKDIQFVDKRVVGQL